LKWSVLERVHAAFKKADVRAKVWGGGQATKLNDGFFALFQHSEVNGNIMDGEQSAI